MPYDVKINESVARTLEYASYATAKETKAMNEPLNGSFDGIGVQFNMVEVPVQP